MESSRFLNCSYFCANDQRDSPWSIAFPQIIVLRTLSWNISGGYYSAQQTLESVVLDDLNVITNNRK